MKPIRHQSDAAHHALDKKSGGFSLIELIIVVAVITILAAISVPLLVNYKRLYKADDQSLKMMDMIQEAGQLAMTRRRIFRFEIDLTDNSMRIVDENNAGTAADDRTIKTIPLDRALRVDQIPNGVVAPNPPNYNDAVYQTVNGRSVWAVGFRRDGSVVNASGNPVSANLYVWEPQNGAGNNAKDLKLLRAITLFSGSGAVRYWKHDGTAFVPY